MLMRTRMDNKQKRFMSCTTTKLNSINFYCCIHREALKILPKVLLRTTNKYINIIKFIILRIFNILKTWSLNLRTFEALCQETRLNYHYQSLLFCTEGRYSPRHKILTRLFHFRIEISQFMLNQNILELNYLFEDHHGQLNLDVRLHIQAPQ